MSHFLSSTNQRIHDYRNKLKILLRTYYSQGDLSTISPYTTTVLRKNKKVNVNAAAPVFLFTFHQESPSSAAANVRHAPPFAVPYS